MRYFLWALLFVLVVLGQVAVNHDLPQNDFLSVANNLSVARSRFLDWVFSGNEQDVKKKVRAIIEQNRDEFLIHPDKGWSEKNLKAKGMEWDRTVLRVACGGGQIEFWLSALLRRAKGMWSEVKQGGNGLKVLLDIVGLLELSEERRSQLAREGELPKIDLTAIFEGEDEQVKERLRDLILGNAKQFLVNPRKGWAEENLRKWKTDEWGLVRLEAFQDGEQREIRLHSVVKWAMQRWKEIKEGANGAKIFLNIIGLLELSEERRAELAGEGKLPSINLETIFIRRKTEETAARVRNLIQANVDQFLKDPSLGWSEENLLAKGNQDTWQNVVLKMTEEGEERRLRLSALLARTKRKWPEIRDGGNGVRLLLHRVGLLSLSPERKQELARRWARPKINLDKIFSGKDPTIKKRIKELITTNFHQFLIDPGKGWKRENLIQRGREWPNGKWPNVNLVMMQDSEIREIRMGTLLNKANERWGGIRKGPSGVMILLDLAGLIKVDEEERQELSRQDELPRLNLGKLLDGEEPRVRERVRSFLQANRGRLLLDSRQGWTSGNIRDRETGRYWGSVTLETEQEGELRETSLVSLLRKAGKRWDEVRQGGEGFQTLLRMIGLNGSGEFAVEDEAFTNL